jgi:hypothetical protein
VATASAPVSRRRSVHRSAVASQTALPPLGTGQYVLVNKNSGKYLEIPASSTTAGKAADQWQNSACSCQLWTFHPRAAARGHCRTSTAT